MRHQTPYSQSPRKILPSTVYAGATAVITFLMSTIKTCRPSRLSLVLAAGRPNEGADATRSRHRSAGARGHQSDERPPDLERRPTHGSASGSAPGEAAAVDIGQPVERLVAPVVRRVGFIAYFESHRGHRDRRRRLRDRCLIPTTCTGSMRVGPTSCGVGLPTPVG